MRRDAGLIVVEGLSDFVWKLRAFRCAGFVNEKLME